MTHIGSQILTAALHSSRDAGRRLRFVRALMRAALTLVALTLMVQAALAQNIQYSQGSVSTGLETGLQIPLRLYPGRGATSLPITLYYSSKVWRINYTGTIFNPYDVRQSEPMTQALYAERSAAGWTSSLGVPTLEWPESNAVYNYQGKSVCLDCRATPFSPDSFWKVPYLTIHMPDGSAHQLRRDDTPYTGPANNNGVYYAVDGSRLRYETETSTLYLPDGMRYILGASTVQLIDRNGNTLNYDRSSAQWTDTLGRVISAPPLTSAPGDYPYVVPSMDGTTSTYIFRWAYLSNALEPDPVTGQVPQLKYAGGHSLNGAPSINNPPQRLPGPYLFETTENGEGMYDYVIASPAVFNPAVLSEIVLPNGLSYKFKYNEYGEVARIIYPTGGFEQYKYGQIRSPEAPGTPYNQSYRGVIARWVSPGGTGTDRAQWQYGVNFDWTVNKYTSWTINPDNTYVERDLFTPSNTSSTYGKFGFKDPRTGKPYEERFYQYQSGPMLRRSLTETTYSARNVNVYFNGQTTTATAMRNSRPTKKVEILLDTGGNALAKTETYQYDTSYQFDVGHDQTGVSQYDFATVDQTTAQTGAISAMPFGQLVSSIETTYLRDDNYRNRNILGLVSSATMRDVNGQVVNKTEMFYDEAAYPLLTYADLSGVADYTDPGTNARGNVTTVRRYVDTLANLYLEAHTQFDQCGNLRNSWNERGILSQTEYSAMYKRAYATQGTTAAPDSSGAQGSNTPFTSSSVFDYTTGLILSSTEANGQLTKFSYKDDQNVLDPMNRLQKVTRPDNSWTKTEFNDTVGNLYIMTETQFDATRTTKVYQFFDTMGRASRSLSLESGASYLVSDVQYDQLGRVWRTSNQYRAQGLNAAINPSNVWTTNSYDVLGRVKTVTLPDQTTVQTEYQGVYTRVTDQSGKKRRQKTDALGRIVRVDEPDATGNLGEVETPTQATYYGYSASGNVIHVQQGAGEQTQHRYFNYDALSRLRYERQAEQSAAFTAPDALTGNTQWTRKITYDENGYQGLVTTMTDARNVSTQYQYDKLSRITQVSYSDGTPTVNNYYDQARAGYMNKGRLTEVQTSAVTAQGQVQAIPPTAQISDFDSMGRVTRQQQVTGSNSYTLSYAYNEGGQLTSQTYPSGRVVDYSYDDSSRLAGVTSGATNYASSFVYGAKGTLTSLIYGNGTAQSYEYNNRLQMTTMSLMKDNNTLQRYEYKYGQVNADGTVDETKNNGQISRIEGFIGSNKQWQQRFSYDSIGRLSQASEHRGDNSQQSYLLNYDYDLFGNRYQHAARNPASANPLPYVPVEDGQISLTTNRYLSGMSYDEAGNVLVDSKFKGQKYEYDANGRQKWTARLDNTGAATSVYDGAGQRVATIAGGTMTIMVYDATGKLVAEYGQEAGAADGTQYVFTDHQGSTRVVTNNNGEVVSRQDYQPFGEELGAAGMRSTDPHYGGANNARQKYAGMEKDNATGMSHTLWRKYDGMSGRWTSPDPYGGSMLVNDPQSFNRYTYVSNDPVNMVDPLGLMGASAGWGSVSNGFWGTDLNDLNPRFGGPGIINAAMNRYQGPDEEETADSEEEHEGHHQQKTENPYTKQNENPEDSQLDQALTPILTDPNENGMVIGASGFRNNTVTDSHYRLATDGTLHTVHVYGDKSGNKIVGVYIPARFTDVTYVGTRMSSVVAVDPKTNDVIRISHVQVKSQKQLMRNLQKTNKAGSKFIGNIGGPQGNTAGNKHAHLTFFRGKSGMDAAMTYKYKVSPYGEYDRNVAQYMGDFRSLLKR